MPRKRKVVKPVGVTEQYCSTSYLNNRFAQLWLDLYPNVDLHSEYKFYPRRRFAADFCHLQAKVIIEIQGATHVANRGHSSSSGIARDCAKTSLAAHAGYAVFLLTSDMITEEWLQLIAETISSRLQLLTK